MKSPPAEIFRSLHDRKRSLSTGRSARSFRRYDSLNCIDMSVITDASLKRSFVMKNVMTTAPSALATMIGGTCPEKLMSEEIKSPAARPLLARMMRLPSSITQSFRTSSALWSRYILYFRAVAAAAGEDA